VKGWIKLHRKILDNELWHDVTTFRLFTLLLLRAVHQDGVKIKGIELKRSVPPFLFKISRGFRVQRGTRL
jgi:hypothetical protein